MKNPFTLYGYWRSSAAYRVRIGLNLKGIDYRDQPVSLIDSEQRLSDYAALNPQQLVPTLKHGERVIRQSLAILEYLDEVQPEPPIMPTTPRERARVRALALAVACDIHPLQNLRVTKYLETDLGATEAQRAAWFKRWIEPGLAAIEQLLADNPGTAEFCEGDYPTIADCCLIPQLASATRFGASWQQFPTIVRIERNCAQLDAFARARPEVQIDAPK
jgi:maleylacetoacetate isomerase